MYLVAFLEGAGFPLPYEAYFLAYGVFVELGEISPAGGLAGLFIASTMGNISGYMAGRFFGRRLLPWLIRRSAPVRQFWRSRRPLRSGWLGPLIALRFLGFGFGPVLWTIGLQRTPFAWFLGAMALTNVIWITIWGLLAQAIVDFFAGLRNPVLAVAMALVVVAMLLWLRALWRRRRGTSLP